AMVSRFSLLCAGVLLAAGCSRLMLPSAPPPKPTDPKAGANYVVCYGYYFNGVFGDGKKGWDGIFYLKNHLEIVAHLPTKSEFYIRAFESEKKEMSRTNFMTGYARELWDV